MKMTRRTAVQLLAGTGAALCLPKAFGQAAAPAASGPASAPSLPPVPPPPGVFSNSSPILFREGGAGLPAYPVLVRKETPPARAARMKWFHDARFGLFIHWGVYAVPAGTWKGKPAGAEWYHEQRQDSRRDYRALAKEFTAAKYDPQAWAATRPDAGVKYVVITAKHHDGFTLYDSAYSDWNAVKASGAGRDLLQPLADAVRAAGPQVRPVLFAVAGLDQSGRRHGQHDSRGTTSRSRATSTSISRRSRCPRSAKSWRNTIRPTSFSTPSIP